MAEALTFFYSAPDLALCRVFFTVQGCNQGLHTCKESAVVFRVIS